MKKIDCIIMDWAGTAVDYGCFAPVAAFLKAFKEIGVDVTLEQARRPMGMAKIDHIRELFRMEEIGSQFVNLYHRDWTEEDVVEMNRKFESYLFASLSEYVTPIPGVIETLASLRAQGIRIGSTTGYTRAMMDVVVPGAAAKGYTVDNCVTPDGLPKGRPFPYMIQKNMADLGITDTDTVLKYGDTIADIKEGINAKVWTVGVVMGSNEMGLTQEEAACMTRAELEYRKTQVRRRMLEAGAHYVVDTIAELPDVIDDINSKLEEAR